ANLGGAPQEDTETPACFGDLVAAQAARLQPLAQERSIRLSVEVVSPEAASAVPRSAVKLGQALLNVVENAVAAAKSGVQVVLGKERDAVVISVTDDGAGMPEELLAHATEPFVTTKPDGNGMGLAITRAVVEEESGHLEIANRPEGGLLVRLHLPAT